MLHLELYTIFIPLHAWLTKKVEIKALYVNQHDCIISLTLSVNIDIQLNLLKTDLRYLN